VTSTPHGCWEQFRRNYESCSIGTEVCKEESEALQNDEPGEVGSIAVSEHIEFLSENGHEKRHQEKSHHLDGLPAHLVDEGHREPVPGQD